MSLLLFFRRRDSKPCNKIYFSTDLEKAGDIKLGEKGLLDNEFKKALKTLLLKSTKSSSKLFLISFLVVDTAKLY